MTNRHLSRSIALQTLFEWDTLRARAEVISVDSILERNMEEFASGSKDSAFVKNIIDGVISKQKDLDAIIVKAAPEWPIEKISTIDRNILRIGLFELLFGDRNDVPAKVAINEAIELGKSFGGDSSGKFVNGVLGAVYKDIGEPGKEQTSKVPTERLAGAVVYARDEDTLWFAFVHDVFGHWTLSKTHLEDCEDSEVCSERSVKDEMGLTAKVIAKLGENEYQTTQPDKGKIKKSVVYYLLESDYTDIELKKSGGLDDAQWFAVSDLSKLNLYEDIIPIVRKAITIISDE